jgi:hypothetical protein
LASRERVAPTASEASISSAGSTQPSCDRLGYSAATVRIDVDVVDPPRAIALGSEAERHGRVLTREQRQQVGHHQHRQRRRPLRARRGGADHERPDVAASVLDQNLRDRLLVERPGFLDTPTRARATTSGPRDRDQAPIFRPKDASDYLAHVPAQGQRRTRKHEELVRRFGTYARSRAWTATTNVHPRELVLRGHGDDVLVEAKIVGNNAEFAVRDAIGQLFAYRHLLYRECKKGDPRLLVVFSEPIGRAFVTLLNVLGIEAAWFEDGAWRGSQVPAELID